LRDEKKKEQERQLVELPIGLYKSAQHKFSYKRIKIKMQIYIENKRKY